MKSIKPFGSWGSDLTADILANKGRHYGHMSLDKGTLYWLEVRASEKGRGVLMCATQQGNRVEVLPKDVSVRTKVHEYGGGDFIVKDDKVYFSNAKDNNIYLFDGQLTALTSLAIGKEQRYADFCFKLEKRQQEVRAKSNPKLSQDCIW